MAYQINRTDGSVYAVVADGTINVDTSLVLVGKNYSGYGELLNENFFRLLENHANTTEPTGAVVGQLWFDKTTNVLKVYNGSSFRSLGGAVATPTAPTGNNNGDLWWDSGNKQLKVWDTGANSFIVVGPLSTAGTGQSGSIPVIITDSSAQNHVIVELIVDDTVVGVVSKDPTFTPNPPRTGFSDIQPGINLATGNTLNGTAANSLALGGLLPADFVRMDGQAAQVVEGKLGAEGGLSIGASGTFTAALSGNNVIMTNTANGSTTIGSTGAPNALVVLGTGNVTMAGTLDVTSSVTAASFTGVGTALTALNASQLASGTVPNARISGSYTGFASVTGSGTATFASFSGSGASLTALNASQLTSGTVPDARISGSYTGLGTLTPATNNTSNLGSVALRWATVYATTFNGTATTALYADLAERFVADADYRPGTVVRLGGSQEITVETEDASEDVFGVISTDPAYLMNNQSAGLPVALIGRVPVRAVGIIRKNARLVSAGNGCVREALRGEATPFNCVGRALEDKHTTEESLIEAFVSIR